MQQLSKINRGATVSGNFYEVYSAFVLVYLLLINNQTNVIWSGGAVFLALPFLLVPEKILSFKTLVILNPLCRSFYLS